MNKALVISLALLVASLEQVFSQTKPGEGFYLVVFYVTREVKDKVDGFYRVSADGKISLPAVNIELAAEKDIEVLRKKLHDAIQRYCHKKYPDEEGRGPNPRGYAWPDLNFISEEDAKKAAGGMLVVGAVKKPGVYPLPKDLGIWSAAAAAGGAEIYSGPCYTVLRGKEVVFIRLSRTGWVGSRLLKPGDVVVVPRRPMVEMVNRIFGYDP